MMDTETLASHLDIIRGRRLASWNIYQAGMQAKAKAKDEKMQGMLARACERVSKKLIKVDKDISDLEKLVIDIQALRLSIGEDISG